MDSLPAITLIPMTYSVPFVARLIEFAKPKRVVGRSDNVEILEHQSNAIFDYNFISRRQASLEFDKGRFYIINFSRTNVTEINGVKVGSQRVQLQNGDILKIGTSLFAGVHLHYPVYSSLVPDSVDQQVPQQQQDEQATQVEQAPQDQPENTQTIDELIEEISYIPDKCTADEEKLAGLLQAKDKMATDGLTTRDAVKSVPSIWDF